MSIKASIDIGSNSILLLAGSFNSKNEFEEILNEAEVAGLGKGLDLTEKFSPESMQSAKKILRQYHEQLSEKNISPNDVIVTATEASRVATNAQEFFDDIKNELGLNVYIITPKAEAYFSALGVACGIRSLDDRTVTIMDIGGASTEFIRMDYSKDVAEIKESISLPIGSVRAKDWIQNGEFQEKIDMILTSFPDHIHFHSKEMVAIAGTMTTAAAMMQSLKEYSDGKVHGYQMSVFELEDFYKRISSLTPDELKTLFPFLGKRAEIIQYGIYVSLQMAKLLKIEKYNISTYGLRYGIIKQGSLHESFIFRR